MAPPGVGFAEMGMWFAGGSANSRMGLELFISMKEILSSMKGG